MDERQHHAVQKFRSRIEELQKQLEGMVSPSPGAAADAASRASSEQALRERIARGQQEYAIYRIRHGLGSDPIYIDDEILSSSIRYLIGGGRFEEMAREDMPSRIGPKARQDMLLSGFSFAETIDLQANKQEGLLSLLNSRSPLKDALRRWSAQVNDPYVRETMRHLERQQKNFESTTDLLRRRLDHLHRRYENEMNQLDHLELVRVGEQTMIRVSHYWSNIATNFQDDTREVFGIFRTLEDQIRVMDDAKTLLNQELKKLMASVIPLYLALASQQTRGVRNAILGRAKPSIKLAHRMVLEAKQTDYLLPGEGLPVPHPKIPAEFAAIRKLSTYQAFRRSVSIDELRGADTVEYPLGR